MQRSRSPLEFLLVFEQMQAPKPAEPPADNEDRTQAEGISGQIEEILTRLEKDPSLKQSEKHELVFVTWEHQSPEGVAAHAERAQVHSSLGAMTSVAHVARMFVKRRMCHFRDIGKEFSGILIT